MNKNSDSISEKVECIDTQNTPTTLIATTGFHCLVWRSTRIISYDGRKSLVDVVIKRHREPCFFRETVILNRDYEELKDRLGSMVPNALFVTTEIAGVETVIVVAEAVTPWFNIANPSNEEEAVPLLRKLPSARKQLCRFIEVARSWRQGNSGKTIDLYGIDNLVLDVNRTIKFLDSFRVFFYDDLLHVIDEVDDALTSKIEISRQRLEYIDYLVKESRIARIPRLSF